MHEFLIVAGLHLMAVMSPGPDFLMITKMSMAYSRKIGIYGAIGVGAGILVHVTYSLLGIALIISKSIVLFNTIKILGALYLIYIGVQALRSKKSDIEIDEVQKEKKEISHFQAFKMGFLVNVLNPKATLFFLALFTQVISTSTPLGIKILYGAEMSIVTALWFSLVVLFFTHHKVVKVYSNIKHYLDRVFGVMLIGLGIKVASTSR